MPVLDVTMIRIPYVKVYTDRFGRVRRYFRKPGCKPVALPGSPGSTEFMAAYQEALGVPEPRPARQGPGSVGALICDYFKSPAFSNLKPSSQATYRIVLDRFGTTHGHRMVHDMPRAKVAAYVHAIGADRPAMANLTRSVLRKLLAHGVRSGYRTDNPVSEIDRYKSGTRHTWTDSELAAFERRWPLGTRERLAYALLLYTGQRGGDVVKMRRADVSGGAIAVVQEKTGTALSIPIHHELAAALKAGPSNGLNLIGDVNGRAGPEAYSLAPGEASRGEGWAPGGMPTARASKGADAPSCRCGRFSKTDRFDLRSQNLTRDRAVHRSG
jgi:hypothetical protein